MLDTGVLHCGPAFSGRRPVIFWIMEDEGFTGKPYTGDIQCSKAKFMMLVDTAVRLHYGDDEVPAEIVDFIAKQTVVAMKENICVGASDMTVRDMGHETLNIWMGAHIALAARSADNLAKSTSVRDEIEEIRKSEARNEQKKADDIIKEARREIEEAQRKNYTISWKKLAFQFGSARRMFCLVPTFCVKSTKDL